MVVVVLYKNENNFINSISKDDTSYLLFILFCFSTHLFYIRRKYYWFFILRFGVGEKNVNICWKWGNKGLNCNSPTHHFYSLFSSNSWRDLKVWAWVENFPPPLLPSLHFSFLPNGRKFRSPSHFSSFIFHTPQNFLCQTHHKSHSYVVELFGFAHLGLGKMSHILILCLLDLSNVLV